ncbi:UNVERIFIED_CONTAM: ABC transporter C family member 14 [Sesamum radiatum]|uniref:ABC-type xenobiotic transporter n=1 Tax=Sesamum radiatum TaxID=300843 RepID=A0AAW2UDQ2_SESRA
MIMSSVSWLTSLKCSASVDGSSSFSTVLHWLDFIFLSPCPQRILFSAINLLFLLTLVVLVLKRLYFRFLNGRNSGSSVLEKPLLGGDSHGFILTLWFKASFVVTALLASAYAVLTILAISKGVKSQWNLIEVLFELFQMMANVVVLVLIAHEKKFGAVSHPPPLRVYWAVDFVLVCLFAATAIARLVSSSESVDLNLKLDDIFSLVSFPLYVFLLVVAVRGSSGINLVAEEDLDENSRPKVDEQTTADSDVSGYGSASLLSRAVWHWMNPILSKGYKSPLKMDEVPLLPPDHQAQSMAELFELYWPKPSENSKNPVRTMLLRCFWKDLAFTGFLALVRLAVMYVGPVLIQSFISFTSGDRSNLSQGFYLILILLIAKVVEVLSSHQFNFLSQKLGMLMRSVLMTGIYKKGLRLSCSSRQDHGVGQIVNYMAVDCQQLADLVYQLHTLWLMPFQVGVALLLIYVYIGVSAVVSLAAVVGVMFLTLTITRKNNAFQFNVMMSRDVRMKATTEMLNNMRVIKFQAWEDHFYKKIQAAREKEYGWLSKFMYMISGNLILLWSVPILIAALTFGIATLMKVLLMLGRITTSRERKVGGAIAVEVEEGTFAWEDEGGQHVLKDINFEVKKGELAAIVGMVGSGKSSLLASVLGELHKTSGKVRVCGTTAYVAQTSWIQNATIQENILFGSPMNVEKYKNVIKVCSLEKDLEIMEHGDQTEIGERGINLSGGQKQRIQLARAVYQDCDIYLLDDIFSAVDAHTGTEIFKECIRGALKDKTILLVTHQVDFLHNADLILVMRDGKIVQSGKYNELLDSDLDFSALVAAHETSMELVETNPAVSSASSDQVNIDILIPLFLSITIVMYFSLLGILVITCQYAWPTVFIIVPLIWLNIWYQGYYIASARELTRLDQITKAPIIHNFSETISGVMTIRCFRKQDKFFHGNIERVDMNLRMSFHNSASNEWFRLEMIGSFVLCVATVFLILLPSTIVKPEYVGLSLSYGLPLNSVLYWTIYLGSVLENRMVSVERIKQFINIPSEAAWRKPDSPPSPDWPSRGEIEIKNLQVRYRHNTPLVLKGISLTINGGEKIGVVGRTGSGKSTLIQVFFRLLEPYAGTIIVDGVDICKLGLHDLRSRFGIIPQEPVLFEGTVRSNIDPLGLYSDDEIWKSLERCQLKEVVSAKPEKLDSSVVDSGDNWSVGQRQLLCLGRVMLKRSKILFMDEATASVDSQTDAVIQKIIRQDFSACTIITIAHRIPTVIDCDRVLVIDNGWAKEFDDPGRLLERPSLFGALVQEYANRSSGL